MTKSKRIIRTDQRRARVVTAAEPDDTAGAAFHRAVEDLGPWATNMLARELKDRLAGNPDGAELPAVQALRWSLASYFDWLDWLDTQQLPQDEPEAYAASLALEAEDRAGLARP